MASLLLRTVCLMCSWCDYFKLPRSKVRSPRAAERFVILRVRTERDKALGSFFDPGMFNKFPEILFRFESNTKLEGYAERVKGIRHSYAGSFSFHVYLLNIQSADVCLL